MRCVRVCIVCRVCGCGKGDDDQVATSSSLRRPLHRGLWKTLQWWQTGGGRGLWMAIGGIRFFGYVCSQGISMCEVGRIGAV